MPLPDDLKAKLKPLYQALWVSRNGVLPVVGSGLSQGLPSWKTLLESLIRELADVDERAELTDELAKEKYLDVASCLENHQSVGRELKSTRIRQFYQRPDKMVPPVECPANYDTLVQLPCDHYLTTNYDPWLKSALSNRLALSAEPACAPRIYGPTDPGAFVDTLQGSAPLVLMVHGDADRPEGCVLSREGYSALFHGDQAWRNGMRALVSQRRLLFVGYSLQDPDLVGLLEEWKAVFDSAGGATRHFFLTNALSSIQAARLRRLGVEPIAYGDHGLLGELLQHLAVAPTGHMAHVPNPADAKLRAYLVSLLAQTASIEIQGIGTKQGRAKGALLYPIEELYTPLRMRNWRDVGAASDPTQPTELRDAVTHPDSMHLAGMRDELVDLCEALPRHQHLLIEGQPGAGKTTFLRLVASMLARDALGTPCLTGNTFSQACLGLTETDVTPIFVRASLLVPLLDKPSSGPYDRSLLVSCIEQLCCDNGERIPRNAWAKRLESGHAVLLLDGVDEIADESLRQRLFVVLRDAKNQWKCRLIVSSRPIETEAFAVMGFRSVTVEPFGREEIEQFVERWVKGLRSSDAEAADLQIEQHRQVLTSAILASPSIRVMAENPVMLTCLCVVHFNEGKLPEGRARLYQAVIEWLLKARTAQREAAGYNNEFARQALARLALGMMLTDQGKRSSIDFSDAVKLICPELERQFPGETKEGLWRRGEAWLEFECEASGILQQLTGKQLRFWHLTFQEYLAALQLSWNASLAEDWWPIIRDHIDHPQWRETIDVFPGCLFDGPGRGKVDDLLTRLVGWLGADTALPNQARLAAVLGRLLLPLSVYNYKPPQEIDERYRAALDASVAIFTLDGSKRVPVSMRIDIAEALGRAGDPRLKPEVDNFIAVPGTGIKLGKYPVTIEEYLRFVNARGYEESKYWDPAGWATKEKKNWAAPDAWDEQLNLAAPNRPVTGVSWYEAKAYCRWRSELQGVCIRLPTEEEWAAAATSPKGEYPWGDAWPNVELLNCADDNNMPNVGRPNSVGIYPAGAGPYGHLELAGNVWESTATMDGRSGRSRVIRGGSWGSPARGCRSAFRDGDEPGSRGVNLGFRLAAVHEVSQPASSEGEQRRL